MELTQEQRLVRDTVRDFARERLAPHAAEWDRESRFPADAVKEMGELGLMGMMVPDEWGGGGADTVSYALAVEEVAAGDGSCSTIMAVHNSVACMPIQTFGTDDQKKRFLTPLARGDMLGAFCLTEPHTGSDAAAIRTRARKDGDKYILDGVKQFVTNGKNADIAIVFAVTDPDAGKRGLSAFIVPTDTPGYTVASVESKMGLRASDTCQIVLEGLRLTPDLLLGKEGQGLKIALANLGGGRIGIAAQAVGLARAAYEAALAYAKEREAFGTPIIGHQAVAFMLADMKTKIAAARHLTLDAARLSDAGLPFLTEAAMAKLFASEMAEEVCSKAIQVHGGYGYLNDFAVERLYRDARICQIYEGTSEIQRLIIARAIAAE